MTKKRFVALGPGDHVVFTFSATNSKEARAAVTSLRKRSDTIYKVRLWKSEDERYGYTEATRHHH